MKPFWTLFAGEEKKVSPVPLVEGCKHFHTKVHYHDHIGYGFCPDCGCEVNLADVFNNFLDEMRKVLPK